MNPKNKTKIISAFPCLGKTFFAANNKDIALDLESSDFFFDKTGFEDYSSEQFKGLSNRVKTEKEFIRRAKLRGNNDQWINSTIKFLSEDVVTYYSEKELEKISVHIVPKGFFISDLLKNEII